MDCLLFIFHHHVAQNYGWKVSIKRWAFWNIDDYFYLLAKSHGWVSRRNKNFQVLYMYKVSLDLTLYWDNILILGGWDYFLNLKQLKRVVKPGEMQRRGEGNTEITRNPGTELSLPLTKYAKTKQNLMKQFKWTHFIFSQTTKT